MNNFASVEDQYKKFPELKPGDVRILKEWMSKQSHLPEIRELKIILFLSSCSYNIEATKRCIENYYTMRAHYPPVFQERDLEKETFRESLKAFCLNSVKVNSSTNRYVFLLLMDSNPDLVHPESCLALADILTDLIYMKQGASSGHVVVLDGSNIRLGLALKVNFTSMKVFLQYVQAALPINLKELHVVNVSPGVEKIYQLARPFLGKELMKMIYFHANVRNLQEFISEEFLPEDLGGRGPSYKVLHEDMLNLLRDNREYIRDDTLLRADESKRIGSIVDSTTLFGIEGTFKRLEID